MINMKRGRRSIVLTSAPYWTNNLTISIELFLIARHRGFSLQLIECNKVMKDMKKFIIL